MIYLLVFFGYTLIGFIMAEMYFKYELSRLTKLDKDDTIAFILYIIFWPFAFISFLWNGDNK